MRIYDSENHEYTQKGRSLLCTIDQEVDRLFRQLVNVHKVCPHEAAHFINMSVTTQAASISLKKRLDVYSPPERTYRKPLYPNADVGRELLELDVAEMKTPILVKTAEAHGLKVEELRLDDDRPDNLDAGQF